MAAPVTDPDKHPFVADPDDPDACADCGDDASANDHLDPDDPTHVWLDVEGLTAADIDRLNDLVDAGHPAADVVAWAVTRPQPGADLAAGATAFTDWLTATGRR